MSDRTSIKSILLLAANPKGTKNLRLQEEEREIKEQLRIAGYGRVPINSSGATRPRDIQQAMLDFKPQVVHFSGHGAGTEGLVFEDGTGQEKLVGSEALANLFRLFTSQYPIECVVLNACYSEFQAQAIARHVNYVIGMSQAIGDRAAIEFSVGFYKALGAGESFEFAYGLGCNAIELEGIPEYLTPILWEKGQLIGTNQNNLTTKTQVLNPRSKIGVVIKKQITADQEVEDQNQQEIQRRQQEEAERLLQQQQPASTPPSKSQGETDDLSSERGVDYTKLRDLLKAGKWREADEETLAVIIEAGNRENSGYFDINSLENFPCTDLRTIDYLWVRYSKGRFGFSIQKRIWESLGGKLGENNYIKFIKFGERVGWRETRKIRRKNKKIFGWVVTETWQDMKDWRRYDELTFSIEAPAGHLPARRNLRNLATLLSSLASRLENCNI